MESNYLSKKKWTMIGSAAFGVLAAGFGYYLFTRRHTNISLELKPEERIANSKDFPELLKKKFPTGEELDEEDYFLTKQAIFDILSAFYDVKFPDFIKLTHRYREIRRKYLNDMDKYIKCGFEYLEKLNSLFMDGFEKLYEYKIIDAEKWTLSFAKYRITDEEINNLMFAAMQDWETRLKGTKKLTKKEFLKIMEKDKEFLKKEVDDIDNQIKYIQQADNLFEYVIILNCKIYDYLHKIYGVESEDILGYSIENSDDQDVIRIEKEMDTIIEMLHTKIQDILSDQR